MNRGYFHDEKSIEHNIDIKRLSEVQSISKKKIVDINKLLNRVKIEKKNETRKKIIFYSFTMLLISSFGTLIAFLK